MSRPLAPELGLRQTPELLVDQGKEPIHGLGVAAAHLKEEVGDLPGVAGYGRRGLIHEGGDPESRGPCRRVQCTTERCRRGRGVATAAPGLSSGESSLTPRANVAFQRERPRTPVRAGARPLSPGDPDDAIPDTDWSGDA